MASIKSALVLHDGMSAALRKINTAMSSVITSFETVQRASGQSFDASGINEARAAIGKANAALDEMEQSYQTINNQQNKHNSLLRSGASHASSLLSTLKNVASTYLGMKSITKLVGLSDTLTSTGARLELIVDDGGSVEELQRKIYASAQDARGSYTDTMATVAKLGLVAGDAFSGNDEMIKFTELVNKNFVVGGAAATEQASAMYQLTQALGSGRLQGDEYRSIIENAPLLAKSIEDYMRNVKGAEGSMKDWASEGMLTADVIKAAVFNSADEVEERFNSMPKTWSQVWTSFKNQAVKAFTPLANRINAIFNSERFQLFVDSAVQALHYLAGIATYIFDNLGWLADIATYVFELIASAAGYIYDNWSTVGPVIGLVVGALVAYTLATKAAATAQAFLNFVQNGGAGFLAVMAAAVLAGAAIAWYTNSVNQAYGLTLSVAGMIGGVLMTVLAGLGNMVYAVWDIVAAVIVFIYNAVVDLVNFLGNVFNDPIGAIVRLFANLADGILGVIEEILLAIDGVLGTDWSSGIAGFRDDLAEFYKDQFETEIVYASRIDDSNALSVGSVFGADYINYDDAFDAGYWAGDQMMNTMGFESFNPDDYAMDVSSIAGNTEYMADNMEKSTEELEYLRDIAEQEAINRFTTAEVKIDMTGMTNRIDSNMDIDGVIGTLTEGFVEALSTASEGAYD